ncbi:MAG TPA: amidohydrolase family protein [Mycobacteriales bacterium]|nr:amidohydrolase family protein [Mycobacteriales bacterium]
MTDGDPPTYDEAAAVRAFWTELGLPGLVDVHVHFMPDNVMAKVWAYFDAVRTEGEADWPVAYRASAENRLALLRDFGVRVFPSLVYPHKPGMAAWLNDWAAGFAAETPDCLRTATFYPEPEASAYVGAALGRGTQLFKAHVQVGGYDPLDPLLDDVWGQLADAGGPLILHAGSGPLPGPHTGPAPIAEVLRRHPQLVAVIAHMGVPEYADFLALAETYERVHLDTTMVFTDFTERYAPYPPELLPRLVALQEKVLFGSDFPNIPYPYLHQLEVLARLDLGDEWLRAVCHDNAVRLLGL